MKEKTTLHSKKRWQNLWQFIKFALVGVSNTLISEGVYAVLVFFRVHYLLAYFFGFVLSVLNAYYWSNRYVFKEDETKEKRIWWQVLLKTYIAYFWGYLVSSALLVLWIDIVKISRWTGGIGAWCLERGLDGFDGTFWGNILAAAINLVITVPMNYLLNKYWAYRQKK